MHTNYPRFIASAATVDNDGLAATAQRPTDVLAGLVYTASEDTALYEVVWIDLLSTDETKLHALLSAAADAPLTLQGRNVTGQKLRPTHHLPMPRKHG